MHNRRASSQMSWHRINFKKDFSLIVSDSRLFKKMFWIRISASIEPRSIVI